MEELERATEILESIIQDPSVPRNIKNVCQQVIDRLKKEEEKVHIRIGAAINLLDELSQDPNLPFHARTQIWEVASLLETAASKIK